MTKIKKLAIIQSFFKSNPNRLVSVKEISKESGIKFNTVRRIFSILRKQNIIFNVDKGTWKATKKKGNVITIDLGEST